MGTYSVRAYNTATASLNKIHDDTVAKSLGFAGGLVPGVDVYAYLCHVPAARWGRDWLAHGTMSARFASPVYDGDAVVIEDVDEPDGSVSLTLRDSTGAVCATATATAAATATATAERSPSPILEASAAPSASVIPADGESRPDASPESLAKGTVLAAIEVGFQADRAPEYLDDVREQLALFRDERVAHPGWLLRQANYVLSSNVRLGPWIHVSSESQHLGVVEDGDRVITSATVSDNYERKGHRFVELDVTQVATPGDRPIARITHTAIYQPRGV
jgi:acyl dehydratase